jgi:uncharacterized protein GlcG (DUF336 family)
MFSKTTIFGAALALAAITAVPATAQAPAAPAAAPARPPRPVAPPRLPYGAPLTLEQLHKVAAAAEAAMTKENAHGAIAIVDNNGEIVFYEQATDTGNGFRALALQKARFSARFRLSTAFVGQSEAAGNHLYMSFPDAFAGPGGEVLVLDGKTVGAIGVSGGADGTASKAGAAALLN